VEEVIRAAGFTVENGELWQKGLAIIAARVADFTAAGGGGT
jgi:hypothetical protein